MGITTMGLAIVLGLGLIGWVLYSSGHAVSQDGQFLAHDPANGQPAWAEYSPAGVAKVRGILANLQAGGVLPTESASGFSVPLVAFDPFGGGLTANSQLTELLKAWSLSGTNAPLDVWFDAGGNGSLQFVPKGTVMTPPFALLTDSLKGWA